MPYSCPVQQEQHRVDRQMEKVGMHKTVGRIVPPFASVVYAESRRVAIESDGVYECKDNDECHFICS